MDKSSGLTRAGYRSYLYTPRPHQGQGEIARRLRQEIRALAKRAIEYDTLGRPIGSVWEQLTGEPSALSSFNGASPGQLLAIRSKLQEDLT